MYTYLAIERTPGFLKAEVVVQILVLEVAAFKRDIIAVSYTHLDVYKRQVWEDTRV